MAVHQVLDRSGQGGQCANAEMIMDMNDISTYFAQLNDYEKYAWIASAIGFLLVIVGIVLLF
jgi:hypothetical protein